MKIWERATHAHKVTTVVTIAILMSGCSNLHVVNPPSPPPYSSITGKYEEIIDTFNKDPAITPSAYVSSGYVLVDGRCDQFFRELADARRTIDYVKSETVLGFTSLSAVLAVARAAASSLAYVAAGASFVTATIDNSADYVLLTRYTDQLDGIVDSQRRIYKALNPASAVTGKVNAVDVVAGYAKICTVDQLEIDIAQSLDASKIALDQPESDPVATQVELQIMKDLSLASQPSGDDLKALYQLLTGPAKARKEATGTFSAANGVYWKKTDQTVLPAGKGIVSVIKLLVPSATAVPAATAGAPGDKVAKGGAVAPEAPAATATAPAASGPPTAVVGEPSPIPPTSTAPPDHGDVSASPATTPGTIPGKTTPQASTPSSPTNGSATGSPNAPAPELPVNKNEDKNPAPFGNIDAPIGTTSGQGSSTPIGVGQP